LTFFKRKKYIYFEIEVFFKKVGTRTSPFGSQGGDRPVNHEDFDDIKKIKPWIMIIIIKKGENVNV